MAQRGRPLTDESRRKGGRRVHETGAFRGHLFGDDAARCGARGGQKTARQTRGKTSGRACRVRLPGPEEAPARVRLACAFRRAGRSLNWIAATLGVSQVTITKWLRPYREVG